MKKLAIYAGGGVLVIAACAAIVAAQPPKAAVEMGADGKVKAVYVSRTPAQAAPVMEQDVAVAMANTTPPPAVAAAPAAPASAPESKVKVAPSPQPVPAQQATPESGAGQIAADPAPQPNAVAVALTFTPVGPKAVMGDEPLERIPEKPLRHTNGIITVAKSRTKNDGSNPKAAVTVSTPNPFDVRFVPVASLDEYVFKVTGHLWGTTPVVFVNGKTWAVGDNILGFNVHKIRTDGCIMEKDGNYFFLPSGQKVTIRLPK